MVWFAVLAGGLLGFVLERGGLCFHSTWRGLMRTPRQTDLAKAYGLYILVSVPIVQALIALGVIDPWVPPLLWRANIIGGLVFGLGMVIASTCVTGIFYKFGHGMLGAGFAAIGWAIGDIAVYRGPLQGLRDRLRSSPVLIDGETATVGAIAGWVGPMLVLAALLVLAWVLWPHGNQPSALDRGPNWGWIQLGLGITAVGIVGWLLVSVEGSNYSFGTSGASSRAWGFIGGDEDNGSWWIPLALVSTVPGSFVAAKLSGTLWIRGESTQRYGQLLVGGLVMGAAAGVAGGCNLGHSLVGIPLLSAGSVLTTAAMILGVLIGSRLRWLTDDEATQDRSGQDRGGQDRGDQDSIGIR